MRNQDFLKSSHVNDERNRGAFKVCEQLLDEINDKMIHHQELKRKKQMEIESPTRKRSRPSDNVIKEFTVWPPPRKRLKDELEQEESQPQSQSQPQPQPQNLGEVDPIVFDEFFDTLLKSGKVKGCKSSKDLVNRFSTRGLFIEMCGKRIVDGVFFW
jgi:hypothetical protein